MASWDGKSKGNRLGYSIFVALLKMCGVGAAYLLLYFVAAYFSLFSGSKSVVMYRFFRRHIGWSRWRSLLAVYRNYYIFGQTLIDKIAAMGGFNPRFTFEFDGEHWLHEAAASKKGMILMGGHLGNWEIAGHYLFRIDAKINIVMYSNEYQSIKSYLDSVTGEKTFHVIEIKDDFSHIYEIIEVLNRGEFVCIHGDRCFANAAVEPAFFINEEANFPKGVFKLCTTFNVPITFVFAFKESRKHYHFYATPPKTYSGSEKWKNLLADFVAELQQKTLTHPLHWFNYFDFWQR